MTMTEQAPASTKPGFGPLAGLGLASIGAGAIHAAAAAAHGDARQAAWTFTALAGAQIAWGIWALIGDHRGIAVLGGLLSASAVIGWLVVQTVGISFIDGFETAHDIAWADFLAAALAAVVVVGVMRSLLQSRERQTSPSGPSLARAGAFAAVAVVTLAGVSQSAGGGHDHGAGGHDHGGQAAVVPPKKYDPEAATKTAEDQASGKGATPAKAKRVDLSGTPGVSAEQQERAEALVEVTLDKLPQWASQDFAKSKGFDSIHDGFTGTEHLINWSYINDEHTLDPDYPESLVYDTTGPGEPKLVSAMYMLSEGATLDDVPDIGGPLTQWHIHDNLCYSVTDPPRIAGITDGNGDCRNGTRKLEPVPMIHVWITAQRCGPFAALDGIGAGQVKEGEEKACNAEHSHGF